MSDLKPTILCLNDQETALMIRKLVLESHGYLVVTTTESSAAIDIVQSEPIDLVIADHLLGDGLGTDVAAEIKRIRPNLPIILLSGVPELPEHLEHVDAFVSKAEAPKALLETIARLIT